ncbi:MAG: PAS domain-containing protein, partial [Sphingomonadaceae bacterium]|nr:PAS domain-containing protein [Sphingomonadaceae bacterium]
MAVARGRLSAVKPPPSAETLLAAMPGALIVLDAEGRVACVNAAAEMLLNASAAWLMHKPLGVVLRLPETCLEGVRGEAMFAAFDCMVEG